MVLLLDLKMLKALPAGLANGISRSSNQKAHRLSSRASKRWTSQQSLPMSALLSTILVLHWAHNSRSLHVVRFSGTLRMTVARVHHLQNPKVAHTPRTLINLEVGMQRINTRHFKSTLTYLCRKFRRSSHRFQHRPRSRPHLLNPRYRLRFQHCRNRDVGTAVPISIEELWPMRQPHQSILSYHEPN